MTFLSGLIVGYLLGLFAAFVLALVVYAHREPPIRGYQPLPPTLRDPPPMPECKPVFDPEKYRQNAGFVAPTKPARDASQDIAQEAERGVRYEFIGVMGDSES